ncbi:FAM18-like protein (macronuclear) [Tetrahymena thermophila SB210]|uniref:Golgi apparatus membrane protein TVP23 homolog n=1 Tax=Tetrahymena thermophila (strain SB210) TaxID=312017 RepID=Q23WP2_TETTS|nr:FAM18-like protein [Tetrahymena thermophila SB210]EAS00938.4 FAM18-like protein [Tetrahymena thermophila SB210]|eukprot:XP_001021183.4 FAM18-like protein [Tetrahymena thermophila SB210]
MADLQGGNFYAKQTEQIANQLTGQANNFYQSNLLTNDNMAVLRNSQKYVPKENVDAFAQFLQMQHQQGNVDPQSMLKSAVQLQKQQQDQNNMQLANFAEKGEQALMKRLDFSKSNHPTACFFHLLFKALALICHLILSIFMDTLKVHYFIIIFSSLDFWVVKNITGRLLIGLRWWSEQQSDNTTKWVFECKINQNEINSFNFNVFWSLQIIAVLSWATLLVINVIGFDIGDSAVCAFSLFTTFWNAYYFYKCNTKQKQGLKKLASELQSDIPLNFMSGSLRFPL